MCPADGIHLLGRVEVRQRLRHLAEQRRREAPVAAGDCRLERLAGRAQQGFSTGECLVGGSRVALIDERIRQVDEGSGLPGRVACGAKAPGRAPEIVDGFAGTAEDLQETTAA